MTEIGKVTGAFVKRVCGVSDLRTKKRGLCHRLSLQRLERRLLLSVSPVEFSRQDYAVGDQPQEIVVGEFDSDDYLDMLVSSSGYSLGFTELLGRSGGGFWRYDFGSGDHAHIPLHLATGNINGDQWTDMVVSWPYDGRVGVYYGSSIGFSSDHMDIYLGGAPLDVTPGDFNNDGRTDFAVANYGDGVVNVLYGLIGGGFGRLDYDVGEGPTSVLGVDLDDDGRDDLVVANSAGDSLTVLRQGLFGNFVRDDYSVGDYPMDTVVSDFDDDGYLDIAVANADDGDISILYGDIFGEFGGRTDFSVPVSNGRMAVTDLNGDSQPDILVTNDGLSVLYGDGPDTFVRHDYSVGATPNFIAIADFNEDGLPDVAVSNYDDDDVSLLTNLGVPASIELLEPSGDLTVQRGIEVTIEWIDEAEGVDASISLAYDPDLGNVPWSDSDHQWIVQGLSEDVEGAGDGYVWDTSGVEPGTYTVWAMIDNGVTSPTYARAVGKVTIEPNPAVTVDLQEGSDSGYSDSDNITNNTMPVYDITVNLPGTVRIDWDGDGTPDLVQVVGAGGTYSFQPALPLPDGIYPVDVTFADAALNEATDSNPTVIDTIAPSQPGAPDLLASSDLGLYNDDRLTSDSTPSFGVAPTDSLFVFYRNGVPVSGSYSSGTHWASPSQPDGTWTFSYAAVDLAGNISPVSPGVVVTIDTEAPDPPDTPDLLAESDTGVSDSDNLTFDSTPTLSLAGYGTYYRLYRNGALVSSSWATEAIQTDGPLADGEFDYELRALDIAGNESQAAGSLSVTVDTTGPVVQSAEPEGTVFEGEQYVTVRLDDMNSLWLASVEDVGNYELLGSGGDGVFGNGNDVDRSGHIASITYDENTMTVTLEIPVGLAADSYRLTVSGSSTLYDAAGNALDGDGDGVTGGDFVHEFATNEFLLVGVVNGPASASVYVYDFEAPQDVQFWDVDVKFGKGDSVKSIKIGGRDSGAMAGVGIFVDGASEVGSIIDGRKNAPGTIAFIGSDSPVKMVRLNSTVSGYDVGGETLGSMVFPADVDGDGDEGDGTAVYVEGWLGAFRSAGGIDGDLLVLGVDAKGYASKKVQVQDDGVTGDLRLHGAVGQIDVFGNLCGQVLVAGDAKTLRIRGGDLAADAEFGSTLGKLDVRAVRDKVTKVIEGGSFSTGALVRLLGADTQGRSAKSVSVQRDFDGALDLAGGLVKLAVNGDLAGTLESGDDIINLKVSGDLGPGTRVRAAGLLNKVSVKGEMIGGASESELVQITASRIGSVQVRGDVSNARVLAGCDLGADWSVDDGDLWGQGTFDRLIIGGNVTDSLFAAGVQANGGVLDLQWMLDNDAFVDGSVMGAVVVKGALTSTSGTGMPFGVGAWRLDKVKVGPDRTHPLVVSEV